MDQYVYRGYTIGPRYIGKLMRIFKKHNLEADKVGYVDDDLEVDLYGTREDLEAFLKGGGMGQEIREIKRASTMDKTKIAKELVKIARELVAVDQKKLAMKLAEMEIDEGWTTAEPAWKAQAKKNLKFKKKVWDASAFDGEGGDLYVFYSWYEPGPDYNEEVTRVEFGVMVGSWQTSPTR